MGSVSGNMDPFYCYPCCCAFCGDCSCYYNTVCLNYSSYPYQCSAGSCQNCYWPAHDIAYTKLTNGCDTSCGCRPDLPELPCGLLGILYDYDTGWQLENVEVVDCGPGCSNVCNHGFIGCMTVGTWMDIGNGYPAGTNLVSYYY